MAASRATRPLHQTALKLSYRNYCFVGTTRVRSQRPFSTTPRLRSEKHRAEKDDIVVESQEYSKSGFDSWAAETENTAFDKRQSRTGPDEQLAQAEKESQAIGQSSNPLNVSPANKEISEPFQQRQDTSQSKVPGAGQESKRTAAPKGKALPRYDDKGDEVNFKGTGSYRTQNQEQAGPKFPGASRRGKEEEGKEQWPERTERRKYVGPGR